MSELKPAYLLSGDDESRLAAARRRLRERAADEGGSMELFEPAGKAGPDAEELANAIGALSLVTGRRYLVAEGVEGWRKAQVDRIAGALGALPPETTVVMLAHGKAPKGLAEAVEGAGGQVTAFEAPSEKELPGWIVAQAAARGFAIERDAARLVATRVGNNPLRLSNELDRLAVWADGRTVEAADLDPILGGEVPEQVAWALADAVLDSDPAAALRVGDRLLARGEPPGRLVFMLAGRLRAAVRASERLSAGVPPGDVAGDLPMHPYAARQLVRRVRGADPDSVREALGHVADLEAETRGESDRDEQTALVVRVRAAAGGS